ncbi:MAG TPA: ATP-binding cassette domain-containing protein [Solirubrobacteraceae bacterium]|jgi:ABC-2 type transport system ATP-binding protein
MTRLALDGVTKRFGAHTAVGDVSFGVPEGALFGLLGPNGAGKTTTIRMLLGILEPDAGTIAWGDRPVRELPRAALGYLPEERGLYSRMPVREQIEFFALLRELEPAVAAERTDQWLARMELAEYADRSTQELSKGNQQKVQLACAVVHQPRLLVLDEPFSGLDPINNQLFEAVVQELHADGTTIVLSTHDMEQVEALCSEVALLNEGRLLFTGELDELRRRHADRERLRMRYAGDRDVLERRFPQLEVAEHEDGWWELTLDADADASELLDTAIRHGQVDRFRREQPSLREIFIAEVGARR